jgi:hypothetical protein
LFVSKKNLQLQTTFGLYARLFSSGWKQYRNTASSEATAAATLKGSLPSLPISAGESLGNGIVKRRCESDCQKKMQRPAMSQVLVALSNALRLWQYGQYVNTGNNQSIARRSKR